MRSSPLDIAHGVRHSNPVWRQWKENSIGTWFNKNSCAYSKIVTFLIHVLYHIVSSTTPQAVRSIMQDLYNKLIWRVDYPEAYELLMSIDNSSYNLPSTTVITFSDSPSVLIYQQTSTHEKRALELEFWKNLKDVDKYSQDLGSLLSHASFRRVTLKLLAVFFFFQFWKNFRVEFPILSNIHKWQRLENCKSLNFNCIAAALFVNFL